MTYTPGANDSRRVEQKPRRLRPRQAQYRAQRNALWLAATERGLPFPDGVIRRLDVDDLAGLWSVTNRAVYYGIANAERDRRALAAARSGDG